MPQRLAVLFGVLLYGGSIMAGRFRGRDVNVGEVYEAIGAVAAGIGALVVYDGESTWEEGAILLGLYTVIAASFWRSQACAKRSSCCTA